MENMLYTLLKSISLKLHNIVLFLKPTQVIWYSNDSIIQHEADLSKASLANRGIEKGGGIV